MYSLPSLDLDEEDADKIRKSTRWRHERNSYKRLA